MSDTFVCETTSTVRSFLPMDELRVDLITSQVRGRFVPLSVAVWKIVAEEGVTAVRVKTVFPKMGKAHRYLMEREVQNFVSGILCGMSCNF